MVRLFTRQLFFLISRHGWKSENLDSILPFLAEELLIKLTNLSRIDIYNVRRVFPNRRMPIVTLILSTSQSACRIVQVDSRVLEHQEISVKIFNICFLNDITFEPQWISCSHNLAADSLGKTLDLDDWQLNLKLFVIHNKKLGRFIHDRFASMYNKQFPKFNSRLLVFGN